MNSSKRQQLRSIQTSHSEFTKEGSTVVARDLVWDPIFVSVMSLDERFHFICWQLQT